MARTTVSEKCTTIAAVGGATWRHLHGVEAGSDEGRRGDAWGEGGRRHAYRTGEDGRLEGAHADHRRLLHRRDLRTCTGVY